METQAGGQIAQMIRPVEQTMLETYRSGAQAIAAAQSTFARSQAIIQATAPPSFFGVGVGADLSTESLVSRALGMAPIRDYRYSPQEAAYLYGREAFQRGRGAALGGTRGALEVAGEWTGTAAGWAAGGWLGTAIAGTAGGPLGMAAYGIGALAGASLGSDVGGSLYGPVGGAGLGYMGGTALSALLAGEGAGGALLSGAGALLGGGALTGLGVLGAGVGAVAGTGAMLLMEHLGARGRINPLIQNIGATSVTSPYSGTATGTGFTQVQQNLIADRLISMAAKDYRYNLEDYSAIIGTGAQAGAYDTANTVGKFSETTRQLVANTKDIQSTLRKGLEEALPVLREMTSMGITSTEETRRVLSQIRGSALTVGLAPDELRAGGQMGAAMTRGYLYAPTGYEMGVMGRGLTRFIRQQGAIQNVFGQDETLRTIAAAGGEEQVSQDITRTLGAFAQSSFGQGLLQAAYNPETRRLNSSILQQYVGGGRTRIGMMTLAAQHMSTPQAIMNFQRDRERLVEEAGAGTIGQLLMRSVEEQSQMMPGMNTDEAREYLFEQQAEQLGLSPMSARATYAALKREPQMRRYMAQANILRAVAQADEDYRREVGVGGAARRVQRWVSGEVADAGAWVAQSIWDPMVGSAERFYQRDILGLPPSTLFRGGLPMGSGAIRTALDEGPSLYDLRSQGDLRPTTYGWGISRFLLGSYGGYSRRQFQGRFGDTGAYGYGEGFSTMSSQEAQRMVDAGQDITILKDLGWFGGQSLVMKGNWQDLKRSEQENSRLQEVMLGSSYGVAGQANEYQKYVDARIREAGTENFSAFIKNQEWAQGADRPSLRSAVAAAADYLHIPEENFESNQKLRDALANRVGLELSVDQIHEMGKNLATIDPALSSQDIPMALSDMQDRIQGIVGTGVNLAEVQEPVLRMAELFSRDLGGDQIETFKHMDVGDLTNYYLNASGVGHLKDAQMKGGFPVRGSFVFNEKWSSGSYGGKRRQLREAARGFAERVMSLSKSSGSWWGDDREATATDITLGLAAKNAQVRQTAADTLGSYFKDVDVASGLSVGKSDAVYKTISSMAGSKDFAQLFDFLSVLDEPDKAAKIIAKQQGISEKEARAALKEMGPNAESVKLAYVEEDILKLAKSWEAGASPSEWDKRAEKIAQIYSRAGISPQLAQSYTDAVRKSIAPAAKAADISKAIHENFWLPYAYPTDQEKEAAAKKKDADPGAAKLGEKMSEAADKLITFLDGKVSG